MHELVEPFMAVDTGQLSACISFSRYFLPTLSSCRGAMQVLRILINYDFLIVLFNSIQIIKLTNN